MRSPWTLNRCISGFVRGPNNWFHTSQNSPRNSLSCTSSHVCEPGDVHAVPLSKVMQLLSSCSQGLPEKHATYGALPPAHLHQDSVSWELSGFPAKKKHTDTPRKILFSWCRLRWTHANTGFTLSCQICPSCRLPVSRADHVVSGWNRNIVSVIVVPWWKERASKSASIPIYWL